MVPRMMEMHRHVYGEFVEHLPDICRVFVQVLLRCFGRFFHEQC